MWLICLSFRQVIILFLTDGQRGSAPLMDMRSLLTLSVLLALIREDKGEKPTVSLLPRVPDVFVGDDVTLICKGGGEPIQWIFNGTTQLHKNSSMLLTSVTSKNNGKYECERGGSKSDTYTLDVLELEPHAQLSPPVGGAVMTKGDGRNLVLQVEDDLKGWKCYVLRGESTFRLGINRDDKKKKAVMFAELKEAKRATFWCKNGTHRSNAVTLKMTELKVMLEPPAAPALKGENVALRCAVWGGGKVETAKFYRNNTLLTTIKEDTYIITGATENHSGEYSCLATYRYSHISANAAKQEGKSDAQELKVIGGPPATTVTLTSPKSLLCSCSHCPNSCTSYRWYRTLLDDSSVCQRLAEDTEIITVEEEGRYSCRKTCGKGFSRFSNVYSYKHEETTSVNVIMVAGILLVVGVLIVVVLVVLKRRRGSGGSSVQATAQDKDKATGGDYEQIQLTDHAVYHTLGESTDKDKVEGGYEALKKRQEAVYHTLGAGEGQGQGEGQSQGESQGGYEALKNVKVEVYQTLSSADTNPPKGESEGGYEQLPQKPKDNEAVTEENPYEELKAGQQDKIKMSKEKE